jgi:geranylgeranyl pyrophosphate synthase
MFLAKDERNKLWAFFRSDGMVMAKGLEETIKILENSDAIDKCIDLARELVEASWLKVDALSRNSFANSMLRVLSWFVVEICDY